MEDIHIHHLTGSTLRYADRYAEPGAPGWWGKGEPIFISATPRKNSRTKTGTIRNVTFDNLSITCESCAFLAGEPESCLRDIRIRDLHMTFKRTAIGAACVLPCDPRIVCPQCETADRAGQHRTLCG